MGGEGLALPPVSSNLILPVTFAAAVTTSFVLLAPPDGNCTREPDKRSMLVAPQSERLETQGLLLLNAAGDLHCRRMLLVWLASMAMAAWN